MVHLMLLHVQELLRAVNEYQTSNLQYQEEAKTVRKEALLFQQDTIEGTSDAIEIIDLYAASGSMRNNPKC